MERTKEILAESFRKAVEDHFHHLDDIIEEKFSKLAADKKETELYQFLDQYQADKKELVKAWEDMPLSELDGRTPGQIIQEMNNLDDLLELLSYMAKHTDEDIPGVLIRKLQFFGQEAIFRLEQLAGSRIQGDGNSDYEFVAAVTALGEMGLRECAVPLIRLAITVQDSTPMLDHIQEALKNIGAPAIEPILEQLEANPSGKLQEMLLYALANAGAGAKDERIYQRLRNAFRTSDDKLHAVICLSVYGDGRAVPLLRGFLQKNSENLPKNLFYEIIGTIRNLGGNAEDFIKYS